MSTDITLTSRLSTTGEMPPTPDGDGWFLVLGETAKDGTVLSEPRWVRLTGGERAAAPDA